MVPAFFALDGRSLSAHAAILVAHALSSTGVPAVRIRLTHPGEPNPFADRRIDEVSPLVEIEVDKANASAAVDASLAEVLGSGRKAVLDLPIGSLRDEALRNWPDVCPIVPVGPSPLEASTARMALALGLLGPRRDTADRGPKRLSKLPWLLPCNRSGGSSGVEDFRRQFEDGAGRPLMRVLPAALPALSLRDLRQIWEGRPSAFSMRHAVLVAMALRDAMEPEGAESRHKGAPPEPLPTSGDDRSDAGRLRDLAEDMQSYEDGLDPSPDDLAKAPVLRNWAFSARRVRAIRGDVYGHPTISNGRLSMTSEVFYTDGRSFARTFSRLYRLGASNAA